MPLFKGRSKAVLEKNLRELENSPTVSRTRKKFGKARAEAQKFAIAKKQQRKSRMPMSDNGSKVVTRKHSRT